MSEQPSDTNPSYEATAEKYVETIASAMNVDKAFGPARVIGEFTVIPVAEVAGGLGGGFGTGRDQTGAAGGGSGGGGGVAVRPIAALVVGPEGVRVQPVFDLTRIGLAALTTVAFGLAWTLRLRQGLAVAEKARTDPGKALKGIRRALR